ncbi:LOW QUALITY PROTEIN: hypothetical protein CFOL_v3_11129, partial [Cephalotus follicularis]
TKDINILKASSLFRDHSINQIYKKETHLHYMQQEISNQKFEQPLQTPIQQRVEIVKNKIITNLCLEFSDAFWHRKCHLVFLPYDKNFSEQNISTKARPIQMTHELMEHCKKEIEELLHKKLIRPNKSPWRTITPIQRSIICAEKFPDIITDKKQLQRFLGSLNYIRD